MTQNLGGVCAADLRTYIVNLRRRPDRRARMEACLPAELTVSVTSDWEDTYDGHELTAVDLEERGCTLFPWQIDSDNPWWNRPLKYGEIGCTLAHLACWRHARDNGNEPFILILEDDAVLPPNFLDRLVTGLDRITAERDVELLYLGRVPLEPDQTVLPGVVVPGYSHCTFGYLLSRQVLDTLLEAGLDQALVPIDEFLPAMYLEHPRADLRARFPRRLSALAFEPPVVTQLSKDEAGSDTEDSDFVTDVQHVSSAQSSSEVSPRANHEWASAD